MQESSELGMSADARLAKWDIKKRLHEITTPTLMIGAKYDTMDPKAMEEQSKLVKREAICIVLTAATLRCGMIRKYL